MITTANLRDVLKVLGFEPDMYDNLYVRTFADNIYVKVDFEQEKIIYPEEQGFVVNERQTTNFSDPENFVVLECVCRLLVLLPLWSLYGR